MTGGSVTFTVADAEGQQAAVVLPYTVVGWLDDFTQGINTARWNIRNNDTSANTDCIYFPANVTTQADGVHLTARRQSGLSKPYTSGYIDTVGKSSASTGLWEIVAKLPPFKGSWGALWLRCDSTAGEIDILEAVGPLMGTDVETVHQSTNGDMDKSGFEYKPAGLDLTQWHTFGLRRDADGTLTWLVNGTVAHTRRPTDIDNQGKPMTWLNGPTFASPLNLRINLQVGGAMPAWYGVDVDSTSQLPADFVIRSVRWTPLN
jgi:beta-glucanase (GH16 family)